MKKRIVDLVIAAVSAVVANWLFVLVMVLVGGSVGTVERVIVGVVSCGIGVLVYRRRRKRARQGPAAVER